MVVDAGEITLSDREFARIRQRVYDVAGISLSEAKRTLVVSRLAKVVRALRLPSFEAYLDFLETGGTQEDRQTFVNALTTNLTRFYREEHHFSHLCEHLPALMEKRARAAGTGRPRLRIWSAGCSTGQEAYTIAMSALAAVPELRSWDFRVLATDIDTAVLAKAARATYSDAELEGLPPARASLFEPGGDGMVRIPGAIRDVVAFKPLNLMATPWPMRGPFDAIFCRNVAIYFDRATQSTLFARLGAILAPDGYLYIGHSETVAGDAAGLRLVGKTIYQRRSSARRNAA
jgi:chemotaxis protein methyltransferase CheR